MKTDAMTPLLETSGPLDLRDYEGNWKPSGCEGVKCNTPIHCGYFPSCPHDLACRAHGVCIAREQHAALFYGR